MSQRTEFITVKVYGVVGADNVLHTAIAEDNSDEVWFQVLTEQGEYETFEAEAYHLFNWCREYGFIYYEGDLESDVDMEEIPLD
jgi:hypothetical protein